VQWTASDIGGTQAIVGSPFTPTLAISFGVNDVALRTAGNAMWTMGVANDAAQWSVENFSQNGQDPPDVRSFLLAGEHLRSRASGGAASRPATFLQFTADGMEVSWPGSGAANVYFTVFFRNLKSHVEVITPPLTDSQQVVSTSIQPEASLSASVGVGGQTQSYLTAGFSDGGTQDSHSNQMADVISPIEADQRLDALSSIFLDDENKIPRGRGAITFSGSDVLIDWTQISDAVPRPVGILALQAAPDAPEPPVVVPGIGGTSLAIKTARRRQRSMR
jgi:hypothetical protein